MKRFAVALVLAAASTAAAQPASKARTEATAAYQQGQRLYLDEDYAAAAVKFEAAYKLDPDPAYLFNIAQAYRLAKDCTHALAYYKQFISGVPKAPNADAVNKYIVDLEATCPPLEPAQPPPPVEPDREAQASPMPKQQRSHMQRNLAIGAFGLGAVAITVGAVFTFKVRGFESDREALCPAPCDWTPDDTAREAELKFDGDRASTLAITGYVVGGLAIASGIALLVTAPRHADMLTIAPTQGGAFATFTLRH